MLLVGCCGKDETKRGLRKKQWIEAQTAKGKRAQRTKKVKKNFSRQSKEEMKSCKVELCPYLAELIDNARKDKLIFVEKQHNKVVLRNIKRSLQGK